MNKKKKKGSPKSGTKNVKKRPVHKSNTHSPISKEIVGICMVGISLLILIGLFTSKSGLVGEVIRTVFIGLFGIGGYIIPVIVVGIGVFYIQGNMKRVVQTTIYSLNFLLILVTFFHVLCYTETTDIFLWSMYFIENAAWYNGGFIGATLGYLFLSLFGLYGTYVVLGVCSGVWLLIVTQFPIFSWIHEQCGQFFMAMKDDLHAHHETNHQPKIHVGHLNEAPRQEKAEHYFEEIPVYNASDYDLDEIHQTEVNETPSYQSHYENAMEQEVFESEANIPVQQYAPEEEQMAHEQPNCSVPGRDMPLDLGIKHEVVDMESANKAEQSPMQSDTQMSSNEIQMPKEYVFPPVELLNKVQVPHSKDATKKSISNAKKLEETLASFGVEAKVTQIHKGPAVTRYELQPKQGVKVSKIVNLADDIALNLAAPNIRIEAPIQEKQQ